ncbi:receptor-like protein kinase FERONIA [Malus sylvestris]|uniref:receptor-like protein kinase FERONIA n=1 Tax=Malus sylvestris TaxID=3752 RepID=UPI0021ACD6E2|nr:receptor-like protein kinase FERONIA [Malus sylvestris]
MKNPISKHPNKTLTPLLLPLFFHMITMCMAGDSPPIYRPSEQITLQCGSSGTKLGRYPRYWNGDIDTSFFPFGAAGNKSISKEAPSPSSSGQAPYSTARLSRFEFTYTFPLYSGPKFIRLYFYPASYAPNFNRSQALFSVKAGGFTLLHDFNASVTADASGSDTIYKEFCLHAEAGQNLNITFTPSKASPDAYAFINGIEILSMPPYLYYTSPRSPDGVAYVGSAKTIRIENNTALEMVYRINIGGQGRIYSDQDTGMYRNWDGLRDEYNYLDDLSRKYSILPQNSSIQLNFSKIPEYSAPKEVYQSGRSMGESPSGTITDRYNLTWEFPVDSMFAYLVRLHFCEFDDVVTVGDRVFNIYIANQSAEKMADIIEWSGGNGRPVYRDYAVFMSGNPAIPKKVNLFLALESDLLNGYWVAILNGLEMFKLSANRSLAGPSPDPPPIAPAKGTPSKPSTRSRTPLLATVVGVACGILGLSVLGFLVFRRRRKVKGTASDGSSSLPTHLCRYFSLAEIKAATQNFSQSFIVGVGGFGHVYKGHIDGGATPVAIKRLKPDSSQGAREFKTEIELLSELRHRHLVSLIGYCTDKNEIILVYDYMARGTLADHLYQTDNPPLSWGQRLQICIGAARGLSYLHSDAQGTIIHRDVKSTNILLDEKWVAKVSDFGLSKVGTATMSKTHISTAVKGSFGYLDPEYYRRQQLTVKSDVYSFGVVLCEVLCARPAVVHATETRQMNLAEWTKSCHRDGELDQIIDPNMKGKIETECLNKYVEIAMSCIHDSGMERPSMNDVVRGLEFALQLHQNCGERNEDAFASVPGCTTNESVQCISETIFSEINDPNGR